MQNIATATESINKFAPTNAIFVNALDSNGYVKKLALFYSGTDEWLGSVTPYGVGEELGARLSRLLHEDSNVVGFQNKFYRIENGVYRQTSQTVPVFKSNFQN